MNYEAALNSADAQRELNYPTVISAAFRPSLPGMKKKISVGELRVGMYVAQLDRAWIGTPFLFQGFEIRKPAEIKKLRSYCQHVFIDTEQGAAATPPSRPPAGSTTRAAASEHIPDVQKFDVLKKFVPGQAHPPHYPDTTTLEQEIPRARDIVRETRTVVSNMMEDARLGRAIDMASAKQVVANMVESVICNPDALVCYNELKTKDEYTALHSLRVCVLALAFGRHLEFTDEELGLLGVGALLHDIGKMRVPLDILNKPDKLTDKEFEIMKSHVPQGVEILGKSHGILPPSIEVVRLHHERFDGAGYANGLRGEAIGLFGSIGAIVDCYDAVTSDRVYHTGMTAHEALRKMYSWRDKDFHPGLLEQFIQCMGIYPIGSVVELSTGSTGVVISVNRRWRLRPRVVLVLTPDKTPYAEPKIIDLMHQPLEGPGREVEIRRVLPASVHNIVPTKYIPYGA